jgi:hypothetical protein
MSDVIITTAVIGAIVNCQVFILNTAMKVLITNIPQAITVGERMFLPKRIK